MLQRYDHSQVLKYFLNGYETTACGLTKTIKVSAADEVKCIASAL
jgi:hypothetical protein